MAINEVSEKICKDWILKFAVERLIKRFCQRDIKLKMYIAMRLLVRMRMQRTGSKILDANKMVTYTAVGLQKRR